MADPTVPAPEQRARPARFGPQRIGLVPVTFSLLGSLPVAASSPLLTWVLLLPIACGVWVVRARVVAAPVGLEVCNGLGVRRLAWSQVDGFDVPRRGPVRLVRTGRRPLLLTALPRRDLPRLLEVGRQVARGSGGAPAP